MAYRPAPSRRAVLGAAGALFAWNFMPRFAHAAGGRDPRFVVIILRGALDGLTAVPPIGDPSYKDLRQSIALTMDGPHPALRLDGFFALDPSMPNFARLYHANQAAVVHACATAYRDRSHFDGQDVLESGYPSPGHVESGWLNRLLLTLPKGEKVPPGAGAGWRSAPMHHLSFAARRRFLAGRPPRSSLRTGELPQRLMDLYAHTDPLFARLLTEGIATGKIASGMDVKSRGGPGDPNGMEQMATGAARLLAAAQRSPDRGAGFRRMGYARPGARAAIQIADRAGQCFCSVRARAGPSLEGYRGRRGHGVRTNRSHQWHAGHRSRHGHDHVPRGRSRTRRSGHRRLAGSQTKPVA